MYSVAVAVAVDDVVSRTACYRGQGCPVYPEHPRCFLGDVGTQENHVSEILSGPVIEVGTICPLDADKQLAI